MLDYVREFRFVKNCECEFTPEEIEEIGICMTGNDEVPYCAKCDKAWKQEPLPDIQTKIEEYLAGSNYDNSKDSFIHVLQNNFLIDIKMLPVQKINSLVEKNIDAFVRKILKDFGGK